MGGSSFFYSTFTQGSLTTMQENNVDVSAAAGLDFLVHVGADVTHDQHYSDWQTYNASKMSSSAPMVYPTLPRIVATPRVPTPRHGIQRFSPSTTRTG